MKKLLTIGAIVFAIWGTYQLAENTHDPADYPEIDVSASSSTSTASTTASSTESEREADSTSTASTTDA